MKKHPEDETNQGRRDALKKLATGVGGLTTLPILGQAKAAVSAMPAMPPPDTAKQPAENWEPQFFDAHQDQTLIALTELIIPATDTPGAKAALVNRYLDLRYNEETPAHQQEILQALAWFDGHSLSLHNKPFVSVTETQQKALLEPLAAPTNPHAADEPGVKAFTLIKSLTIFGYYTSQIGLDEELKYEGDRVNPSFPGACTHPEHRA
jgi:hypothetical protein